MGTRTDCMQIGWTQAMRVLRFNDWTRGDLKEVNRNPLGMPVGWFFEEFPVLQSAALRD